MKTKRYILQLLTEARAASYANGEIRNDFWTLIEDQCERKKASLEKRGAMIVKCQAKGAVSSYREEGEETFVEYKVHLKSFIKQGDFFYMEENVEKRSAQFFKDTLVKDEEHNPFIKETKSKADLKFEEVDTRGTYNRLQAIQYAELWWQERNPKYHTFEVNCTNYISQCLHEGGISMRGYPNRSKGWWMQNDSWSYSWSVANAFHRLLKSGGLGAKEVGSAEQLIPGDVICYDFEGDRKWNHTTIVVNRDLNGMPLVNANTYDSRMRYWDYTDSTAYTPNIKYAFFHINS
ncbi:amidase domain-containing protein [Priestia filamentosa]|uniref:amidase domain-containing protein n=1 Tax=Priestia filamentosa TaxID=1402861 RepID=UPI001FB2B98F|nr:amidase domain-containing protein [Priestia filamentosa]MED3726736.1 amidase domain-containing protein [Priestia filamentosa]UOE60103.1 amidase domain-containing protein [Priestia filamentosa]